MIRELTARATQQIGAWLKGASDIARKFQWRVFQNDAAALTEMHWIAIPRCLLPSSRYFRWQNPIVYHLKVPAWNALVSLDDSMRVEGALAIQPDREIRVRVQGASLDVESLGEKGDWLKLFSDEAGLCPAVNSSAVR